MMAQRNGNHSDEKAKPVEGAAVYVYTMTGETATITDVHDNPITHPVISDQAGNYAYRAADGYYQEQTWFGERRVKIETGIFIGDPNLSFQVASAEVVAASAQISVDAASVSTDKGLASQYRDAAQGYAGDAQTALGLVLAAKTDVDSSVNAALAASHRYSNDATGLAGTTPGTGPASFYFIKDGSDNLVDKQNVAGVATPTSFVLPGKAYMDATLAAALAAASPSGDAPEWKMSAVSSRAPMKQSQKPESVQAAMRRERSGASPAGARPLMKVVVHAAVQDSIDTQNMSVRAQSHMMGSPASAPKLTGWATGADCMFTASEKTAGTMSSAPSSETAVEKPNRRMSRTVTVGVRNAPRPKKKSRRFVAMKTLA